MSVRIRVPQESIYRELERVVASHPEELLIVTLEIIKQAHDPEVALESIIVALYGLQVAYPSRLPFEQVRDVIIPMLRAETMREIYRIAFRYLGHYLRQAYTILEERQENRWHEFMIPIVLGHPLRNLLEKGFPPHLVYAAAEAAVNFWFPQWYARDAPSLEELESRLHDDMVDLRREYQKQYFRWRRSEAFRLGGGNTAAPSA